MNNFNCKNATVIINNIKQLKTEFDKELSNNIPRALEISVQLKNELKEAFELFDPDQIAIREEIARNNGYAFVDKFNSKGIARAASEANGWNQSYDFLIDESGGKILPKGNENIQGISDFSDGLAVVNYVGEDKNFISYYIDEAGNPVDIGNKTFYDAKPFKFGVALVQYPGEERHTYHLIKRSGEEIMTIGESQYNDTRWSESGYLGLHRTQYGAFFITPEGKRFPEFPKYWDELGNLNNGIASALDRNGVQNYSHQSDPHYFYIDQTGKRLDEGVLSQDMHAITEFYKDRAYVETRDDHRILLIDTHGNIIKALDKKEFGDINRRKYSEGFYNSKVKIGVWNKERWVNRVYDSNGDLIFDDDYKSMSNFSEGLSIADKEGKHYIVGIDKSAIECEADFDRVNRDYCNGVAAVEIKTGERKRSDGFMDDIKDYFYIDKRGRRVF